MFFRYLKYLAFTSTSWALSANNDDVLVGGQAVIEGVMMRSPKGYSVAVRRRDGTFRVVKETLQTVGEKWKIFKLPILRGVGVLGQALVLGVKTTKYSADEAVKDEEESQSAAAPSSSAAAPALPEIDPSAAKAPEGFPAWLLAGSVVFALAMNIGLFIALPLFITGLLQKQFGFESHLLFNAVDGVLRVATFVTFLATLSLMKDMRRMFEFHGAEHKTVYNFEARETLSVEHARKYSTLHPRCGTSFLLVLMVVSIVVFSLVHFDSTAAKLLSRIVLLPLIAGISYEIIRYSAKHPGSLLRIVTYPGLLLQKITTKEPDESQLATAIKALEEALSV